jgi:hypothetical protein
MLSVDMHAVLHAVTHAEPGPGDEHGRLRSVCQGRPPAVAQSTSALCGKNANASSPGARRRGRMTREADRRRLCVGGPAHRLVGGEEDRGRRHRGMRELPARRLRGRSRLGQDRPAQPRDRRGHRRGAAGALLQRSRCCGSITPPMHLRPCSCWTTARAPTRGTSRWPGGRTRRSPRPMPGCTRPPPSMTSGCSESCPRVTRTAARNSGCTPRPSALASRKVKGLVPDRRAMEGRSEAPAERNRRWPCRTDQP